MTDAHDEALAALRSTAFRGWQNEKELQDDIASAFLSALVPFRREAALANTKDRPDFLVGRDTVVEVKVAGSSTDVFRQLLRYAEAPNIKRFILVTSVRRHQGVPAGVCGKPVTVVMVGRLQ